MKLEISTTETEGGKYKTALKGRLDTVTYQDFEYEMARVVGHPKAVSVCVDLAGLNYISSMGLRALLIASKKSSARHLPFALVNPIPTVAAVLEIAQSASIFSIFATAEEADAYLQKVQGVE